MSSQRRACIVDFIKGYFSVFFCLHVHTNIFAMENEKEPCSAYRKYTYRNHVQSVLPLSMILDRCKQRVDHEQLLDRQSIE